MSYSDSFPAVSPQWQCNFAANGGRLEPRMTYSRASTGTFFGTDKVLSSENLLFYSNPNDAAWTEQGSSITLNQAASPDGTTTASLLTEDSSTGVHRGYRSIAGDSVSGQTYTFVGYLKANGRTLVSAQFNGSGITTARVEFDLSSSGTATSRAGSPANLSISQIGSTGWYKCSFQATATGAATMYLNVYLQDGADSTSYTGDGSSGAYAWGCNVSTTGQLVHEDTSGQIARSYQTKLQTAASGAARFEHSATDGQSEGILIESQSTNLATYSKDGFNAAGTPAMQWSTTAASFEQNAGVAPSGQLEAALMRETSDNDQHRFSSSTTTSAASHTLSVYVKPVGGLTHIGLRVITGGTTYGKKFKYSDDTTENYGVAPDAFTIEDVGNGWKRYSVTRSCSAGTSYWYINALEGGSGTYAGNDYRGFLYYGVQFEANAFPSSWVDTGTGGSTATRAADSLSVATADIGYTGGPVSVVGEFSLNTDAISSSATVVQLTSTSGNDRAYVYRDQSNERLYGVIQSDGGYPVSKDLLGAAAVSGTDYKFAFSANTNDYKAVVNNGTVHTDTDMQLPNEFDKLAIGYNFHGGAGQINGHYKRLAIYSSGMTSTNVSALTS